MKLSKRLKQIEQMVSSRYAHIWDCCCDHGYLGAALLDRNLGSTIHFVDIVPTLMTEVETKLQRHYPLQSALWKTHCLDVAKLPIGDFNGQQLVIIAGVGGDLMIEFIEALHKKQQEHKNLKLDFLLCPVHHQFSLRQKLIELGFSLNDEVLVEDNKRFYEILHVSLASDIQHDISPVGDSIWQGESAEQEKVAQRYLHKTLSHYQRIQKGNNKAQHIIDAYNQINLK
ncbi:tRNA (adenine(22)-N(1))-methyltransferase TrmK [Psychrosphaera sp. 1_MG-2023]|uniref:tRNA (adenine(22)-N(1))-methyltransferase n=1 Tax=unclassified Psychrosphaera TaxID=2641570 RepID=UPI002091050C|nr:MULTISPECIES: tRNA (adenine(22)-N(1))-methyltransferase TrmK [unclassified Psychrosphaera]MDO6718958.1 tRNA (adenine(22)-N(1))-methyltransferase TrmK [Psychrosphaera sp. 1_MG-2023]